MPWILGIQVSGLVLRFLSQPLLVATGWFVWKILFILSGVLEALALPAIFLLLLQTVLHKQTAKSTLEGVRSIAPFILGAFLSLSLAAILNLLNCVSALGSSGLIPVTGDEANITLGLFGFLVPVALAMSSRMLPLYAHIQPFPTQLLRILALAYFGGIIFWLSGLSLPGMLFALLNGLGLLLIGMVVLIFTGYFLYLLRKRARLSSQLAATETLAKRALRGRREERRRYGPYGGPYADGARQGAPQAQQVADRWHLLSNLSETMKGFFLNKKAQLNALVRKPSEDLSEQEASELGRWYAGMALSKRQEEKSVQLHQERVERYHKIHDLSAKKVDPANIARQVGISRQSVYSYLKMSEPPARTRIHRQYQPLIEPYKEYLVKRWNDGCRNAQLVYREIKEQGYTGSDQPIVRFFAQFREKKERRKFKQVDPSKAAPIKAAPKRPPTASQIAHWIIFKEEQRLDWQQQYLTQLCEADPQIAQSYDLIQDFTIMLRERQGECLDAWLQKVEEQGVSELKSFALGLKRDYDAVKAGLTLAWSQGPVEGHVHRLKLLKRQMYGKASFQTLRKRVLQCS